MKKTISLFLIFLLMPTFLYAEASPTPLMADRESYNVGDPIKLKIEVEGKGYRLKSIDAARIAPFEITGKEEIYNEETGRTSFIIKGVIYDVGEFSIPHFVLVDAEGNKINTASGLIVVQAVRDKEDDNLRALKPQMSVDERGPVWPWVVLALIVISIVFLIFYLYRRKKAERPVPTVPEKAPYDVAIEALAEVAEMNLIRDGKIKRLYTDVSDIVRSYEGALYGFDAMEMTTGELVETLKENAFSDAMEISRFLGDCDRVKFAKHNPPDMDVEGLIDRARRIIDKQKPDLAVEESHAD